MDGAEDAEGSLDPRIQTELESLNNATDDINKLETELGEARTAFRQLLSESTRRLTEMIEKLGSVCIDKARCYYEALEVARNAQVLCQQQAQLFQRASEIHAAAKETVAVAEARFMSHQHEWNFDQAWQDMLNHATIKVMDAENQKAECGREHRRRAMLFHEAERQLLQLEEKHRRSIIRARPYFEMKAHCDQMLTTQKERVECLQKELHEAKRNYAASLRTLEEISNQIHQQRRDYDFVANGPREPGVGAELEDSSSPLSGVVGSERRARLEGIPSDATKGMETLEQQANERSADGSESTSPQWELEFEGATTKTGTLESLSSRFQRLNLSGRMGSDQAIHAIKPESPIRGYYSLTSSPVNFRTATKFANFSVNFGKREPGIDERDGVGDFATNKNVSSGHEETGGEPSFYATVTKKCNREAGDPADSKDRGTCSANTTPSKVLSRSIPTSKASSGSAIELPLLSLVSDIQLKSRSMIELRDARSLATKDSVFPKLPS